MLKRFRESARAASEAVGLTAPSLADASTAAEQHRSSLIAAQKGLEAAEQALQAGHDRGAENAEVTRLEAARDAAKVEVSRAESRYLGAERRLTEARDAEAGKGKAATLARRDEALAVRATAAANMDRLAAEIAEQRRVFDDAAAAGGRVSGQTLVRNALEKAGALPSTWIGDKAQQPGATELAARDADAILAGTSS